MNDSNININKRAVGVIVAAGDSQRAQTKINKTLIGVLGKPILAHTLEVFEKSELINKIIIVTREKDFDFVEKLVNEFNIKKGVSMAAGGASRQESVKNGLALIDDDEEFVVIHDGARPFVLTSEIDKIVNELKYHYSVTYAVPIVDSMCRCCENNSIKIGEKINRNNAWAILTPQAFDLKKLKNAHEYCKRHHITADDDCGIMKENGIETYILRGNRMNIKVTYPEDFIFLEKLLKFKKMARWSSG